MTLTWCSNWQMLSRGPLMSPHRALMPQGSITVEACV